jgi:hypothetical protein
VFIFGGTYAAGWLVYGRIAPPYFLGNLPLPAALYDVVVWPFIWGLTEQMTYNGYLLPRFQVLGRSTGLAVAIVAFAWSGAACRHAVDIRRQVHGVPAAVVGAVLALPHVRVSATSAPDPVRRRARLDGWFDGAASAVEALTIARRQ